jgi:hypothetical protein
MLSIKQQLVSTLNKILPTYYEMFLDNAKTPCITYMEDNNSDSLVGDTLSYSDISFYIKVWSTKVEEIDKYSALVDTALKKLGFKRQAANELVQDNLICKVLNYQGIGYELEENN